MAKKRRKTVKKVAKKTTRSVRRARKVVEPEFMVQVSEPKMVRKDVLEALRETIIFMQGYETVQKIQKEKTALLDRLNLDLRELGMLINHELKGFLPKGKLISHLQRKNIVALQKPKPVAQRRVVQNPVEAPISKTSSQATVVQSGLDDLERQLEEIENKLRDV